MRSRTILHLDDDPQILDIVNLKLTKAGYDVISISDPSLLIETLVETHVQVVLLDIEMPGADGLQLLQEIKKHNGGVHVIMITGVVSMLTLLRSMQYGAEACVFKPIREWDKLVELVEGVFKKIDRWWSALEELQSRRNEHVPREKGDKLTSAT